MTVTGVDDDNDGNDDGNDESVTVTNRSSGGGYSESATVSVTVEDDDRGLTDTYKLTWMKDHLHGTRRDSCWWR